MPKKAESPEQRRNCSTCGFWATKSTGMMAGCLGLCTHEDVVWTTQCNNTCFRWELRKTAAETVHGEKEAG